MSTSQKIIILVLIIVVGAGIFWYASQKRSPEESSPESGFEALEGDEVLTGYVEYKNMKIQSLAFSNNQPIPPKYTCDGENVNPPLRFNDVPDVTESLVLIVDDPDAPAGTWVHWVVWNIPPAAHEILENSVPEGAIEGITDFGKPGYGGPCPPSGSHRYFFKLYALDTVLALSSSADVKDVELAMEGHILGEAQLIGLYQRQ